MHLVLALLLAATPMEGPPPASPEPPATPEGGGFWPTPPAAPPASPPAGATPDPAAGPRPFTLLAGAVLGATDQVVRGPNGLLAFEVGLLVDPGPVRAGVLGSLGLRRDAGAWSLSLLAGRTFRLASGAPLDLLGELGLAGFWQRDAEGMFQSTSVSGGSATLPYAGARLIFGPAREPGGGALGLFVHQTFGQVREPYRVTRCSFLSPCTTEEKEVRYGGWAAGITVDLAWIGRPRPEPPPAAAPASPRR